MGHKSKKLKKEIQDLKDRLELSEEIAEALDAVVKLNLQRTEYHLMMCKQTTGEILMEDVTYCVNLSNRITDYLKEQYDTAEAGDE